MYGRATQYNWEYRTLCDFGVDGRRTTIARHGSLDRAKRAFKRLKKIYSREAIDVNKIWWRCWTEDRAGTIVADTGAPMYA